VQECVAEIGMRAVMLLQDLIKFTSTSHADYDVLQKAHSIAQKYLFAVDDTTEGSQACTSSVSVFYVHFLWLVWL